MDTKITTAYDFHGTLDTGMFPVPNSVVITGAKKSKSGKEIEPYLKKIGRTMEVYYFPEDEESTHEARGRHKGKIAKELGVVTFYENDVEEIPFVQEEYPELKIIQVGGKKKKYIVFSQGWDGMPIAYHLQQEGYDVTVGQIQDKSELHNGDDKEEPDDKKSRLSQFDGMVRKYPASKLMEALKKIKDKEEYFIFFDQNNLWYYAEQLVKSGFTNGLFPTKEDYDFEKDRDLSIKFVEDNYQDIKTIPFTELSGVDEAIDFLEENEGVYVIQSKGDFVSTYVPQNDDPEVAKTQSIGQLRKHQKDYDKGGLIMKEKLVNPVEITPQVVFYNGEPVFTDLDIETKNIGDGQNNGNQVGCGSNLIIATEFEDKINEIAFPPIVAEMASKHTGLFVWDISLYIMPDGIYFGEFCPNRLGYDACMTEMTMAGGVGAYFDSIMEGVNPLKNKFGVAVRLFNLEKKDEQKVSYEGIEEYVWPYEVTFKDNEFQSTGSAWDLAVLTCSSDTIEEGVDELYKKLDKFSFKEVYTRTREDFMKDYPTSIINRFNAINHEWIEAPDLLGDEENYNRKINKLKNDHREELNKFKEELKSILNDKQETV